MAETENVTNATLSKILYDLYEATYNRFKIPFVSSSTEVTEEVHQFYEQFSITEEEIWAYSKKIVHIGYVKTRMINCIRDFKLRKRTVVNAIFTPLYKLVTKNYSIVNNDVLDSFIMNNGLAKGVYEDLKSLSAEAETICIEDAKKMAENVKSFIKVQYPEISE